MQANRHEPKGRTWSETGARLRHFRYRALPLRAEPELCPQLPIMNPNDSLLPKSVVMERLGISDKTLRRLIKQGRLIVVKLGKTSPLKFRQLDVARFLESASVNNSNF